jgi:gamma-glutamyl-gamma-aminobutyrate hydrolase PuuD
MIIGLSQRVLYHKSRAYDSIDHGWYSWLVDHTLFCVANRTDQDFLQLAQHLDMFIITGGDDSAIRRTVELKLATAMLQLGKPILGVCHGCLLLTDVLGGTVGEISGHQDTEHPAWYNGQEISLNSFHTLYINTPPSSATVLVTDHQGNCESWIDGKIAGIMWHPERMIGAWLPLEIHGFFNSKPDLC